MVFEIIILALIVGKIKGGSISKLENLHIRGWYLLVISFSLEILSLFFITKTNNHLANIIGSSFFYIHILIYLLLIIGIFMNFKEMGFKIIFFGSILNFFAIAFNKGRMPVSINALNDAKLYDQLDLLYSHRIITHTLITENTKMNFLGDIIPITRPYPFPKIISIGDILISLGIFVLIYSYMIKKEAAESYI